MHVLLLGGTSEARQLAVKLDGTHGTQVTSSLAGRVADPVLPVGEVRVGGFGGVDGLRAWITDNHVTHVVDATHPYAETMTEHAVEVCTEMGVPLVLLRRAPWSPLTDDDWVSVPSMEAAASALAERPSLTRVLLTIGRQGVHHFAALDDRHFVVRCIDPPEGDMPRHTSVLEARGPFELLGERDLLDEHRIDVVVSKNSGGKLTSAKLQAARERGIPVIMVERPGVPDTADVVATADACAMWLRTRRAAGGSPDGAGVGDVPT
ncbi:MAG: cobalt-precorrin-6A reductase [Rhodococcus sp. (in: high G+C Gram-positive bacteria)]